MTVYIRLLHYYLLGEIMSLIKNFLLFGSITISLTSCLHQPGVHHVQNKTGKEQYVINDFSRLNQTAIHAYYEPKTYDDLKDILTYAHNYKLKVCMAGARHSQGGQAFYQNAIVISLKYLNRIVDFDPQQKLLTIQTGATWKQVQEFLNPHNCAVKIMQFANFFSLGGSLSVNCNGIDPHCGP